MVANNELELYGVALEKYNGKKSEKKGSRTVELFFSFDIVNSSSYKDVNYFGWQDVLTALLTNIQRNIAKEIPEAQLWRVLGDEIIFFVTIKNIDEIYNSIDAIYSVLVKANIMLHNGSFFDELKGEYTDNDIDLMKNSNILAVQAAAWLAIVFNGEKKAFHTFDNVFKKYSINEKQQINEFLGQDIDIGFRIKKETQDRRLVVSLELAKILSDKTEYLSRLNIVTYKRLKGVWKNRFYPIIWYHDTEMSGVSFEDSFYYDETTYSQLSKEYFLNRESKEGDFASYMFEDVHKALTKIIKDMQLESKIEHICNVIYETGSDVKAVENEFDNRLLELHCVAVCCDVSNRRVLIAKRANRKICPGLWEFGCAKANIEQSLSQSIIEEYKSDFGIDIEVICDEIREDKEPMPIALYQVDNVEKLQKGVIVIAKVIGAVDKIDETIREKKKHEKCMWISCDEVDTFNEPTVKDFKETLKKVFSLWDEVFEEK